jgi:hypothetical protein
MNRKVAFALSLLALVGAGCPLGPDDEGTLEINGIVYATVSCQAQGCQGTSPISGAVIGTSLDGQTAVTDGTGYFELKSGARPDSCEMYTITIHATGYANYAITRPWGLHATDQLFGLSRPFPDETNLQCG